MSQQIIINVEDPGILPSLRKVLSMIKGVSIVMGKKEETSASELSDYEQSLEDIKNGRVHTYGSAEDFFDKMGI